MTLGSLFSGRGGFEIGAKAVGIDTAWTCEIDEFLHHKLRRMIPNAIHFRDIRNVNCPPDVEIISAGFPCQDISISNQKGKQGIKGIRSGLWQEVYRIAKEIKPCYLVIENSPELLKNGFEFILRDLSGIRYNVEWDCWRANDFGFPHNRRRLYAIAYPSSFGLRCGVLQPPGTFKLLQKWTPTPAYLRVSAGRANGFRNIGTIQRGDVVLNFKRELHAFGNAVMPVVAEHLFKCIMNYEENK